MAHGQALSLFGRLTALDSGTRTPLPAAIFRLATHVLGTWAHWCRSLLVHHSCWLPELSGVGPGSTTNTLRRWFARVVAPALDRAWRQRLVPGLSALHTVRFDCSSSYLTSNHMIYGRGIDPADARWWCLARHGHDPCPGGQQQVFTCATPLSGRPMRGSLTRYKASTLPAQSEHMLSS